MLAKDKSIEVTGIRVCLYSEIRQTAYAECVNSVLYNIVDAYNKTEVERAKDIEQNCYQSFQLM